jgi:hypothetical protein
MTVMRRGRQDGTPTELSDLLSIVNVMASSYRSTAAASGAETKRRPGNRQRRSGTTVRLGYLALRTSRCPARKP